MCRWVSIIPRHDDAVGGVDLHASLGVAGPGRPPRCARHHEHVGVGQHRAWRRSWSARCRRGLAGLPGSMGLMGWRPSWSAVQKQWESRLSADAAAAALALPLADVLQLHGLDVDRPRRQTARAVRRRWPRPGRPAGSRRRTRARRARRSGSAARAAAARCRPAADLDVTATKPAACMASEGGAPHSVSLVERDVVAPSAASRIAVDVVGAEVELDDRVGAQSRRGRGARRPGGGDLATPRTLATTCRRPCRPPRPRRRSSPRCRRTRQVASTRQARCCGNAAATPRHRRGRRLQQLAMSATPGSLHRARRGAWPSKAPCRPSSRTPTPSVPTTDGSGGEADVGPGRIAGPGGAARPRTDGDVPGRRRLRLDDSATRRNGPTCSSSTAAHHPHPAGRGAGCNRQARRPPNGPRAGAPVRVATSSASASTMPTKAVSSRPSSAGAGCRHGTRTPPAARRCADLGADEAGDADRPCAWPAGRSPARPPARPRRTPGR